MWKKEVKEVARLKVKEKNTTLRKVYDDIITFVHYCEVIYILCV